MSRQNIFDNETFFGGYKALRDSDCNANDLIEQPAMRKLLPDLNGKSVLDLGCGYGHNCIDFVGRGASRVVGIDISEKMLEVAIEEHPDIKFLRADMSDLSFIKRKYDVVFSSLAVHYVEDFSAFAKSVCDVLNPGGYFIFDILNENEVSDSEPFDMDFTDTLRVWFQMTRPEEKKVNLKIRVFEDGKEQFEENIRETIHDPAVICGLLKKTGFRVLKCADRMLEDGGHGTTWFVIARK